MPVPAADPLRHREPELRELAPGRAVACHYAEDILAGRVGLADPDLIVQPVG